MPPRRKGPRMPPTTIPATAAGERPLFPAGVGGLGLGGLGLGGLGLAGKTPVVVSVVVKVVVVVVVEFVVE